MSKITFSFNAKARETATKALEKLILVCSSSSVLFQIIMKEVDSRIYVAIASFLLTGGLYGCIVLIECFKEETLPAATKKTTVRATEDSS